ncbi:MAG: hypothetical protein ACOVNV_00025, partial [Pirellulaceae bacterium]
MWRHRQGLAAALLPVLRSWLHRMLAGALAPLLPWLPVPGQKPIEPPSGRVAVPGPQPLVLHLPVHPALRRPVDDRQSVESSQIPYHRWMKSGQGR